MTMRCLLVTIVGGLFASWFAPAMAQPSGQALLDSKCGSCHTRTDAGLERIKDSRRTPEGWDMTIVRMMIVHGVKVNGEERAALVKHLADNHGLAPQEAQDRRYLMERRTNMVEDQPDETLGAMCARCHSYGRFALQRRTEEDWLKLSHFHMGQYPTIEYQAMARDRNWWEIAKDDVPPLLASHYPLDSQAWTDWQTKQPVDLSGQWRLSGHQPGHGSYHGTMQIDKTGDDTYSLVTSMEYASGNNVNASGNAIVYTGYEFRASVNMDGASVRHVLALSEDGNGLTGRWFYEDNDAIGGELTAVRNQGAARVLSVHPGHLQAGETAIVAIHGTGLSGDVDLGGGIDVVETLSATADTVVVNASANEDIDVGPRDVTIGDTTLAAGLVIYDRVDSIQVEPASAIARVGGDGPLAAVPAQFDAVAFHNGSDGAPGTEDDIRIGVFPAQWSIDNSNEVAAALEDTRFAGTIDADKGIFMPANAGPNPKRPFSTNNAGDIMVKAMVNHGGEQLEGTAHLIVTVQRWVDPPLR